MSGARKRGGAPDYDQATLGADGKEGTGRPSTGRQFVSSSASHPLPVEGGGASCPTLTGKHRVGVAWLAQHAPAFILVVAVLLVFFPICRHEFLAMDDEINVYQNAYVTDFTPANLLHFWQKPYVGMYIPVTYNLWAMQARLAARGAGTGEEALSPAVFHSTNLVLHLLNSLLAFLLLRALLKSEWPALAGALLFALHPAQMEPVAWVTGFKDVLAGFWSLLALWCYVVSARPAVSCRNRHWGYALATVSFLLALLSKPGAVTLPLISGAIGILFLNRTRRQVSLELMPWVLVSIPVILVTQTSQSDTVHLFQPNLWQRLLIAGDSLSFYLFQTVAPFSIGPDYGRTPEFVITHDWKYLTGLVPYLVGLVLLWRRPWPWLAPALIFGVALLPVLGLMPFAFQEISTVADRYLYVALLGPALAIGWLLSRYQSRPLWMAVTAFLLLLGLKSASLAPHWQNYETFYSHALRLNPASWLATHNLGVERHKHNQLPEALRLYVETIKLNPNYGTAFSNLEKVIKHILVKRPEAVFPEVVAQAQGAKPDYGAAYWRLGNLCRDIRARKEAITLYEKAIEVAPDFAKAHLALGDIYKELTLNAKAISAYQRAIEMDPALAEAYLNLGLLLVGENHPEEAVPLLAKASALTPEQAEPYNNLGILYAELGRPEEAKDAFAKAVAINPAYGPALNNLSILYWQQKDYRQAIDYADRARAAGFAVEPAQLEALRAYR